MNGKERSILLVTCYGHFISHFNMLVFPAVLLPLSAEFQFSMVETLSLSFWMYLLFGLSALPWGIAADKVGSRVLLIIFHIGAGICGLLAAFSIDNPYQFSLALTGIGLFSGIYHPAGLGWIAKEIKKTSRGMAYNGMFGNLGLAVAPLFAGLVNYWYGVQYVYLFVGLVNLIGVFLIIGTKKSNGQPAPRRTEDIKVASYLPFIILLVAMMLGGIVYRGTSVTLPAYFELSNRDLFTSLQMLFGGIGTENVVATLVTSLIYLIGMIGQFTGGRVGETFDLRKGYLVFHMITIPAVIAMSLTTNIPLIFFAIVHSFFLLGMQPIENTLVARLTPPGVMSSAYGMKFILTFGVGALSVKVIEVVKVVWDLSSVYLVLGAVSTFLVCTIGLLMLKTSPMKS